MKKLIKRIFRSIGYEINKIPSLPPPPIEETSTEIQPDASPVLLSENAQYIIRFQALCNGYLPKICNPKDKSVLVIGCGMGTEMLWSIMNGAKEVVGVDINTVDTTALKEALNYYGCLGPENYKMLKMDVENIEELNQKFDLVLSLNAFEHVPDINMALKLCKSMLSKDGRIAIFADPLYYSSCGSHLPESEIEPWEHIWNKENFDNNEYGNKIRMFEEKYGLNKAVLSDFLNAIRANNLIILYFNIVPDRNLAKPDYLLRAAFRSGKSITDLTTEGVYMELAYINPEGNS